VGDTGFIAAKLHFGVAFEIDVADKRLGLRAKYIGSIGDDLVPPQLNQAFVDGFEDSLWYVAGVLAVIFLVMFALPAKPQQHVEGAVDEAEQCKRKEDERHERENASMRFHGPSPHPATLVGGGAG